MTLEQLLEDEDDQVLINIELELQAYVVPKDGCTQDYCRYVNKMIDNGKLCINPTTYRKVYLPTLARAVHREFARRYLNYCVHKKYHLWPKIEQSLKQEELQCTK